MKNLLFGLIATVLFSYNASSQKFDEYGTKHNDLLELYLKHLDKSVNKENVYEKLKIIAQKNIPSEESQNIYYFENFENPFEMNSELFQKK